MTRTQALKTARTLVGSLYVAAGSGGKYTYLVYDSYYDAYFESCHLPYADARRSRSDDIKYRALVLSGAAPDGAWERHLRLTLEA
jgi:hypothetical protein